MHWKHIRRFWVISLAVSVSACSGTPEVPPADTVYTGGKLITMVGDEPEYAQALAVREGRIVYVGSEDGLTEHVGDGTEQRNLDGAVLLPGFIDAHGHVANVGFQSLSANLLPPPDGDGQSIDGLVSLLKDWQSQNNVLLQESGWIIGFGYDDSQLAEQRHPTAVDLDRVSTDLPVLIIHQSGHLGVVNNKGLALLGFTPEVADPAGGVIRRLPDGVTPDGVLEEMAFFMPLMKIFSVFDLDTQKTLALAGIAAYTRFGFTTAQEGRADPGSARTWRALAADGKLPIDVAIYPDVGMAEQFMLEQGVSTDYDNGVRIAGVKLSFDGSPQGKTAWLSQPYFHPPHNAASDYAGYPAIADVQERQRQVNLAFENNWQLLVHCNGDAAAQALIDSVSEAAALYGNDDRRTVMIHAQTVREDQLDQMKLLHIVPSFFTMHTFYWGDWHREETLGPERAMRISPTQSALQRGMRFTTHHDAPVALPSAAMILHTSVNRSSRSGVVMGDDQRLSPYAALKSMTDWAAWQYFEEDDKGTLEVGKLADFVILDRDPLAIAPDQLKDLLVLETIKEGQVVYLMGSK